MSGQTEGYFVLAIFIIFAIVALGIVFALGPIGLLLLPVWAILWIVFFVGYLGNVVPPQRKKDDDRKR